MTLAGHREASGAGPCQAGREGGELAGPAWWGGGAGRGPEVGVGRGGCGQEVPGGVRGAERSTRRRGLVCGVGGGVRLWVVPEKAWLGAGSARATDGPKAGRVTAGRGEDESGCTSGRRRAGDRRDRLARAGQRKACLCWPVSRWVSLACVAQFVYQQVLGRLGSRAEAATMRVPLTAG